MKNILKSAVFGSVLVLSGSGIGQMRCGSVDINSRNAVQNEVVRIFNGTLDRMESIAPDGVTIATWSGWSSDDEKQIECLGAAAVPFIVEQLSSRRNFGQLLAVKMLGWVGGSPIIAPLAKVLHESKSQTIRISALESLFRVTESDARPILESVAKSDPDEPVRRRATEILARYHGESAGDRK